MSIGPTERVEVYRARGLPEAHAVRLLLEREGIAAEIDNEFLQGAVGELPMGWTTAPRILVAPVHEAAAADLVRAFLQRPTQTRDEEEGDDGPLRCLACGTQMGEAEACPRCGWSYETSGAEADAPPEVADE
jgi:Putative prokaryotic signal transducing protein